jgi:hypothetical protein
MRKIETLMNAAINNKVDWKLDNTEVIYYSGTDASDVYLHGNLIARVGSHSVELFDGGWQSNTTKSRLNAILSVHGLPGEGVFQKNFKWFLNYAGNGVIPVLLRYASGIEYQSGNWHTVPPNPPPDPL